MRVEKIELGNSMTGHEEFARDWDNLSETMPQQTPMNSYSWIQPHCEVFLSEGQVGKAYLVYNSRKLVGVFPLIGHRGGRGETILHTPFNEHTMAGDIVLAEGHEKEGFECFLDHMRRNCDGVCYLKIQGNRADSRAMKTLDSASGISIVADYEGYGDYLRIRGGLDDYVHSLGNNFRRNLKKAGKKLSIHPDVEFVFLRNAEPGNPCFEDFLRLEASGWKARNGTAILQNQRIVDFYRGITDNLASRGWLEWHLLKIGRRAIAAHMACRINKTLTLLKIAYDEEYQHMAPGNHLFLKMVERAHEQGDTDEINCITDSEWHDNWNMSKREYRTVYVYPKNVASSAFFYFPRKIHVGLRNFMRPFRGYLRTNGLRDTKKNGRPPGTALPVRGT